MTKKQAVSRIDLLNAYRILFSTSGKVGLSSIQKLQPSTLRKTYKKLALTHHPDRARLLGQNPKSLEMQFKKISSAYFLLDGYMKGTSEIREKKPPSRQTAKSTERKKTYQSRPRKKTEERGFTSRKKTEARQKASSGTSANKSTGEKSPSRSRPLFHRMPHSELYLGQYLYYSGHISLQDLIKAVQWQRSQRPSFGQIALEWKIISREDIATILKKRKYPELFGECAFRLGYINHFQYRAILAKQMNSQQPIGRYFVQQGIIKEEVLDELNRNLLCYNQMIRKSRRKKTT